MKIARDSVVLMTYRLSNAAGEVIEDALEGEPVALLQGHGNVIRGLERGLAGHEAGDRFEVIVAPLDGYGERRTDQLQRLSKKYFSDAKHLKPGMQTVLRTEQGQRRVTVVKVGGKMVDVDLNHPLAGETLHFLVNIVEVRPATAAELAHGHAHADGHDHH